MIGPCGRARLVFLHLRKHIFAAREAAGHVEEVVRCCRTCKQFDTGSRFQCRASIETAIGDKNRANNCTHYSPRLVLDVTGRRNPKGRNGGGNDPRSQFESLFKR